MKKSNYFYSFCFPLLILIAFYAVAGYYPFGDKSVLVWDMETQYVSFFSWLNQVLKHQTTDSLGYSFSISLGGSAVGLLGYYLLSPFNLLLLPFSTEFLPIGIQIITMLKIGSCGMAMYHFLRNRFLNSDYGTVLFSTMYALMGYVATQQSNIMWLDGVILLPILMLQIYRIVTERKWKSYPFWIMVAIVTDFYIAYMLILFSVIYFLVEEVCCYECWQWKKVIQRAGILIGSTILGIGISAGIFFPVLYEIFSVGRGGSGGVLESFQRLFDFDSRMRFLPMKFLIGAYDQQQLVRGLPNIYVSVFCLPFVLFYFSDKRNDARRRWSYLGAIAVMVISFASKGLNQIWHGFTYTAGSNYRYSFCCTFLLIIVGYQQYLRIKNTKKICTYSKVLIPEVLGVGIWIAVAAYLQFTTNQLEFSAIKKWLVTAIALGCAYGCLIFLYEGKRLRYYAVVTMIMGMELMINLYWSTAEFHYQGMKEYQQYTSMLDRIYVELKEENNGSFFRMENELRDPLNDAMLIGYPSITHYSSVVRNEVAQYALEHHILAEGYGRKATLYQTDNLDAQEAGRFAIKYLLVYDLPENIDGWVIRQETPCYILENTYFKPLCYLETESDKSKVQIDIENSGSIHLAISDIGEEGNRLLTSIPYRDGWNIIVDGKEYTEVPEDLWIDIKLDQGKHQIDMKFKQPMVLPGICISFISIMIWLMLKEKSNKRKDG